MPSQDTPPEKRESVRRHTDEPVFPTRCRLPTGTGAARADRIQDKHHDVYTAFGNTHGLNPHRSYGCLVPPEVGAVIGRWLRGDG